MKQKFQALKDYIQTHKKQSIIVGVCILVIVIAILTAILVHIFHKKDKDTAAEAGDWDNLIADLEHEPVSENDEVYKDENGSKDKPYMIRINKTQNCIMIYQKDKQGEYSVPLKAMICSVGFDTPNGTFATTDKYTWKIVNGNVWAQYATRVVGNVLIHSMPYSTNDKSSLLPTYYNQLGSTLSASCVRVSAKDSEWIMKNCPKGTTVEIYESDQEEALDRPKAIKVPDDVKWDPTDPDKQNPWNQVQLQFEGISAQKTIERGTQVNYLDGITIKDTCGNDISKDTKVTTDMDTSVNGTYTVKYEAEDATGKKVKSSVNYQVNDTTPPQFCGLKEKVNFTSVSDVTKANILKGITLLDNNELMSTANVDVQIPTVVEGDNIITLTVSDNYGNMNTTYINAIVDANPPVISLKTGVISVLPLTQTVDKDFALSRVTATDNGIIMPAEKINVTITPINWGYNILYTVEDDKGNVGTLKDTVTYLEYTIEFTGDAIVTDINDYAQLTKNMAIKTNNGTPAGNIKVDITSTDKGNGKYSVHYSYTYASPVGQKTAQADSNITLKSSNTPTTSTPAPTQEAAHTQTQTPATESVSTKAPTNTEAPR